MKKILSLLVMSLVSVSVFALTFTEARNAALKNIEEKKLVTFEAIKAEVQQQLNATDLTQVKQRETVNLVLSFTARFGNTTEFKKAFEYAKAQNQPIIGSVVYKAQKAYGWSNAETYNFVMEQFKTYGDTLYAYQFAGGVKNILKLGPVADVKTQKEDLKLLNRIASSKLVGNKAVWEPIVAEIRTVLETY